MPVSQFLIILFGVMSQMFFGLSSRNPFLVPDFCLIALSIAMIRSGDYSMKPAFLLSLLAGVISLNRVGWIAASYILAGLAIRYVALTWDFSNRWLRLSSVFLIESLLLLFWSSLDSVGGWNILFFSAYRVLATVICFHLFSRAFIAPKETSFFEKPTAAENAGIE